MIIISSSLYTESDEQLVMSKWELKIYYNSENRTGCVCERDIFAEINEITIMDNIKGRNKGW